MTKRSVKETLFFILVFLLFYLTVQMANYWVKKGRRMSYNAGYIVAGVVYAAVIAGIFFLAKLNCNTNEGFWDIDPYAKCKGGPYNWQSDDPDSKFCRDAFKTSQGREGIASYNCAPSMIGTPSRPFEYTPISNDRWKNERCQDEPNCGAIYTPPPGVWYSNPDDSYTSCR
jgi:hypothetical protein